MKLFSIPDVERFLGLVEKSRGDVTLRLPDGSQVELKRNQTARQLLQIIHPGRSGLDIRLSNAADAPDFIRYMMDAGVSR